MATVRDATTEVDARGAFVRTASMMRNWVTKDGSSGFAAEKGRYVLYVSYACPWASRCLAFRALKGLEDAIDVVYVAPVWDYTAPGKDEHRGWHIPAEEGLVPDATPDVYMGCTTIRELYEKSESEQKKFTVPVLFDTRTGRIVNNESAEICRMLNSEFNEVAKNPDVDLYPTDLATCIDELNEWIYPDINDGVYKSGFAKSQEAYEEAVETLFAALDRAEDLLSRKRYLTGDRLTEADIRLFVTLVRFDEVYTVHFKCNKKHIREYPALLGYMREIYQLPGIKETVNMWHIKHHYYGSHPSINPHGVVPVGGGTDLTVPHGRDSL